MSASLYVTTFRWRGTSTPSQGLKLSSAGVQSGTPNKKLSARASSITVSMTEAVTTLSGKKTVKA